MKRICIVGISGKLGQYMLKHALDRGYHVNGVCREKSVGKLDAVMAEHGDRITLFPGKTNDRAVIERAVKDCEGVLTVLAPWGVQQYSSGTAQAVMDFAEPDARLIFSCGWHITLDGKDQYSRTFRTLLAVASKLTRWLRLVEIDDQVLACNLIFKSDTKWTVVRGSDLEEGDSEGLPVWSEHVQDPVLASNKTRRIDFALFMVEALQNDALIGKAPAICGVRTESAQAHAAMA
ncbi:GDP-mannose 4,6-dehydratase [Aliiroseovarius pelagivivens]|uniref:GDP-mannose 4,6-dehydratase n=1 Tax=Aliiroseovarius pelagivivens TaxID=1639690 RepID=A0A2R8AHT6_9RHOB|nr:NAD(P)H-binding protein [Aliiroseovarius pelagivivens]SPF75588.1 GDP-mannose 4,6-dehydratase [Aliiroseovarius pelagivivens]